MDRDGGKKLEKEILGYRWWGVQPRFLYHRRCEAGCSVRGLVFSASTALKDGGRAG